MIKRLIVITSIVACLCLVGIVTYRLFLPTYLADLVTQDTPPSYIPEKYKKQIERIQKPMVKYSNEAFKITDSLNLSLEKVLEVIDELNSKEVMEVYYHFENKTVENNLEVFNVIEDKIHLTSIDISLYKQIFIKNATPARINRVLRYAEKNDLASSLAPQTAKRIAKELAIKHYNKGKESLKL
jgi:hypothetical protein